MGKEDPPVSETKKKDTKMHLNGKASMLIKMLDDDRTRVQRNAGF